MRKTLYIIALFTVLAFAACRSGGGAPVPTEKQEDGASSITNTIPILASAACRSGLGAPVPMERYEDSAFSIACPTGWQASTEDVRGMAATFFSTRKMGIEAMASLDFESANFADPVAVVMLVPEALVDQVNLSHLEALAKGTDLEGDSSAEIIAQGEVTLDGAKGNMIAAKTASPIKYNAGMHLVVVKRDDGSAVVLAGFTPENDLEVNLKIFDFMQRSFRFK
jgi:hypothetical protein